MTGSPLPSLRGMLELGPEEVGRRIGTIQRDPAEVAGLGARVSRELEAVLADPGRCGLTASELAMLTVLTTPVRLSTELRRDLYRACGYVVAGRAGQRPTVPVELWRGAPDPPRHGGGIRAGLSWTRKAATAAHFAGQWAALGVPAAVFRADVPPAALLGELGRMEAIQSEVLADPDLIPAGTIERTAIRPSKVAPAIVLAGGETVPLKVFGGGTTGGPGIGSWFLR